MAIQYRSIFSVILLNIITFGFYQVYWTFKTRDEINQLGADIPSAFFMFIPFVNFYFQYKYADAFARFVKRDNLTIIYFIMAILPVLFGLNRMVLYSHYINDVALSWFKALLISIIPLVVYQSGLNQLTVDRANNQSPY